MAPDPVFVGERCGIYYTSEVFLLLGRGVKRPNPKGAATLDELLDRLRTARREG